MNKVKAFKAVILVSLAWIYPYLFIKSKISHYLFICFFLFLLQALLVNLHIKLMQSQGCFFQLEWMAMCVWQTEKSARPKSVEKK